ncbi:MAG: PD40 domain-containing protein [Candidatus Marinimicrobia bacterium]|nr:PD40 domain-containing protein [Candidatus Neomarinimicrobiota bacterium]
MKNSKYIIQLLILTLLVLFIGCEDIHDDPYNPKILFQMVWDIYTINLDGTELENLTFSSYDAYHGSPQFTPDGSNIIFSRQQNGHSQIFIMDIDGENETNLSNSTSDEYDPHIAPNGQLITFISEVDSITNVFLMNFDGSNKIQLTNSEARNYYEPTFSSDGEKIYYSAYENTANYYSMNLTSGVVSKINGEYPVIKPQISPLSDKIVYSTYRPAQTQNIYVCDSNGNNEIQVTTVGNCEKPKFSPDGSHIIYNNASTEGWKVYYTDLNGDNHTFITEGVSGAFTPDGGGLIYESFDEDGIHLYFINLDNNEKRLITSEGEWEYHSIQVQPN